MIDFDSFEILKSDKIIKKSFVFIIDFEVMNEFEILIDDLINKFFSYCFGVHFRTKFVFRTIVFEIVLFIIDIVFKAVLEIVFEIVLSIENINCA